MGENDVDQALIKRVQEGDKRAFDLLVLKYQHKVVGIISRFIHDWAECQDVAQEAFIRSASGRMAPWRPLSTASRPSSGPGEEAFRRARLIAPS